MKFGYPFIFLWTVLVAAYTSSWWAAAVFWKTIFTDGSKATDMSALWVIPGILTVALIVFLFAIAANDDYR